MMTSEQPIWNELVQTVADAISACCINVGTDQQKVDESMAPFKSKKLAETAVIHSKYSLGSYLRYLEGGQGSFNDSAQYKDFPGDFGIVPDAFGVATLSGNSTRRPRGATLGYTISSDLSCIGIEEADNAISINPTAVYDKLNAALRSNGFDFSAESRHPTSASSVKSQIVGASNMYRFSAIVSEFIYRNVQIFVCPESPPAISYVLKQPADIDCGNYGISACLDPEGSYFDMLDASKQKERLNSYFKELLTSQRFFVSSKNIKTTSYKINRQFKGHYV